MWTELMTTNTVCPGQFAISSDLFGQRKNDRISWGIRIDGLVLKVVCLRGWGGRALVLPERKSRVRRYVVCAIAMDSCTTYETAQRTSSDRLNQEHGSTHESNHRCIATPCLEKWQHSFGGVHRDRDSSELESWRQSSLRSR